MTIKTENWLGEYTSTIGTGDITLGGAIDGFAGFSNVGENVDVYYTVMDALDKETGIGTLTGGKLVRKDIHAILVDGTYVKNGSAINLSGDAQVYGTANAHFLDYVQAVANAEIVNTQAIAELKALQINGHALTASFNLTAADVGAHPDSWMPSTEALNVYQKDASDIRYLKTQDAEQVAGLVMRVGGAREQQLQQSINDVSTAFIGDAPPAGAPVGKRWFDTESGRTYIKYNDGDSTQWIEESPQGLSPDGLESRIDEALRRSYAEAGFNLIGDFSNTGLVVNSVTDVVLLEPTGVAYSYNGGLPHTIGAGETPIRNPLWVAKDNQSLRNDLTASGGAGLIGGTAKPVTWVGFAGGADITGTTPSDAAFSAANKASMHIPSGVYNLSSNWEPTDERASINSAAGVVFTGAKPNFTGLIPFQGGPIWSGDLQKNSYKSADWSGYGNIFQCASYATSEIPSYSEGGGNVVAVYGGADAKAANSAAWGGNFVAYANNATGTAIGVELNYGSLVSGGLSYGLLIASSGSYEARAGLQLQTNNVNSKMAQGLRFNNRSFGLARDYLVGCSGDETAPPANIGLDFSRHYFPIAEISTKSLVVRGPSGATNKVEIEGAATGGYPLVGSTGEDANVNFGYVTKGTGQHIFTTNDKEAFRITASAGPDILQVGAGTGLGLLSSRGASTNINIQLSPKGAGVVRSGSSLEPTVANSFSVGSASRPWSGGFTQTAFAVTSDETYKTSPAEITDAMLDAAAEVEWVLFQYLDRIEEKGADGARYHFGAIAQRFVEAFKKHGLDPFRFAFICYDEWGAAAEVIGEDGETISEAVEAGSRYGIRYDQAIILKQKQIERDHKRQLDALGARIEVLESK